MKRLPLIAFLIVASCTSRTVDGGSTAQSPRETSAAAGVTLGFNGKGTVDTETQVKVVDQTFATFPAAMVKAWTIRITGGTRSQTDKPSDWSEQQLRLRVELQKKYGFSFIFVVNGNDTAESQAAFVQTWIRMGARFAFIELMNELPAKISQR